MYAVHNELFLPLLSSHDATAATATAAVDPTHHTVIGTKHSRLLCVECVCAVCNAFKLDMQKFQHMATCEVCVCVYMCEKQRRKNLANHFATLSDRRELST